MTSDAKSGGAKESDLEKLSPERRALLLKLLRQKSATKDGSAADAAAVVIDPTRRFEPFPLTDLQEAYWIGRGGGFELADVSIHSYIEIDGDGLDHARLERSLKKMIERHDMLRAIIGEDGRQVCLETSPDYRIESIDLSALDAGERERRLEAWREELSHEVIPSDRWPLFTVRFARLSAGRGRIFLSMDGLVFDGWSIHLFLHEWRRLYDDLEANLPTTRLRFRDCVLADRSRKDGEVYRRDREYWRARMDEIPGPPILPFRCAPSQVARTRFERIRRIIPKELWTRLKVRTQEAGLTPTGLLLAAYADVLGLFSEKPRFTINIPRFNRPPIHPDVDKVLGEFASFTLLEVDMAAGRTFVDRARRIQEQLWRDLDHSSFTGVEVLREMAQKRGPGETVLMPVVFTASARDTDGNDAYVTTAARKFGDVAFTINQTSQVWLDNHVAEDEGRLLIDWDWVEPLFFPGVAADMVDAFERHLLDLSGRDDAWTNDWIATSETMLGAEYRRSIDRDNSTVDDLPDVTLAELFENSVAAHPDRFALASVEGRITYAELADRARRLARTLIAEGAKPDRLVAVALEKGPDQIVAIMAVTLSGAAYLPIDVESPPERFHYFLEDGDVALAITKKSLDATLPWTDRVRRFAIDDPAVFSAGGEKLPTIGDTGNLACVIYTSGSTGQPKGVMVGRRNIASTVLHTNRRFSVGKDDRVLALTAIHHDLSEYDIFGVLAAGGTLVCPSAEARRDPAHWCELMNRERVTLWNTVPAMMEMLVEYADSRPGAIPDSLRLAILGGDWIPTTLPDRLRKHVPTTKVLSIGGPTETTIWNVWYPVESVPPHWTSIPYGRPTANNAYHVLAELGHECPRMVAGEMACTGLGVTHGYWRDHEKTAVKFVRHPRTGERMYRTGDRGRRMQDGNLEFLGRSDLLGKIHGPRIELGEFEAARRAQPAVRTAAVRVYEPAPQKKALAGYFTLEAGARLESAELAAFLAQKVPTHMVPGTIIFVEKMPLSANGKIDRKALPDPQPPKPVVAKTGGGASRDVIDRVARIVGEVLGKSDIDPDVDFMILGANSLDLVRVGNRLDRDFGKRPRIDELFRMRTLRALAGFFDDGSETAAAPESAVENRSEHDALLAAFPVIFDPDERDLFKKKRLGVRPPAPSRSFVNPGAERAGKDEYLARRSARSFLPDPIPAEDFGKLLACLRPLAIGGAPKYLYASAGATYSVQTLVHVKPGRVEGCPGGTYYFSPDDGRLVTLVEGAVITNAVHVPFINSPIYDLAGFSIFFVSRIAAIAPVYGEHSIRFATLEAGCMSHLLESRAIPLGIGLCHIGSVEWKKIKHLFDVADTDLLLHSMVGGKFDPSENHPFVDAEIDEEGVI